MGRSVNAQLTNPNPEREGLLKRASPYLALAALAVLFCARATLTGKALFPFDVLLVLTPWKFYASRFPEFHQAYNTMLDPVQQYYPWRHFAVETLRQGILPLWDPYAFAGTPFVANLQSAIFYPLNVLFLVMPLWKAFTWGAALHVFLAGAFTCGLLRTLGLRRFPALIGAVAFMFNGFLVAWLEYPAFGLWVMIWLPLVLLLHERAVRRRSWAWTVATGVAIGVQFTGGQLQFAAYLVIFWLAYALLRWLWPLPGERRTAWPALVVVSAGLLGLALAAAQLLPTLELAPRSHRPMMPPSSIRGFALPFSHLVLYLVPNFFGNPVDYNYWGHVAAGRPGEPGFFWESSGYLGAATLVLAFVGAGLWRKPLPRIVLVLAVGCLLLALGTPLYLVLYHLVPGFKQLGGVARTLYPAAFALACLAAFGADSLIGDERRDLRWFWRVAPAAVAAAILLAVARFWPMVQALSQEPGLAAVPGYLARQVIIAAALLAAMFAVTGLRQRRLLAASTFGAAALAVCAVDLFVFGFPFNPATDPKMAYFETPSIKYVQEHLGDARMLSIGANAMDWMPPNTPTVFHLRDIQGSDSLWWRRTLRLLQAAQPGAPRPDWSNLDSPILDLLAVRYLLTTRDVTSPHWRLAATFPDEPTRIYEHLTPLPRASVILSPSPVIPSALQDPEKRAFRVPLRGAARNLDLRSRQAQGKLRGESASRPAERFDEIGPNRTRATLSAPGRGVLVTADPAYPGWRVTVDGKPAEGLVANYLFRAVAVPAGRHVVEWKYDPTSFRFGLFISLAALALVAGAWTGRAVTCRGARPCAPTGYPSSPSAAAGMRWR